MSLIKIDAKVKLNKDAVVDKINNLLDDDTMTAIQTAFAKTIDPWTPFLSGELHSKLKIDSKGVEYTVPYSAKKYYGEVYNKSHHPLATSHWDEVAMQSEMESFEKQVKSILVERVKQLYG